MADSLSSQSTRREATINISQDASGWWEARVVVDSPALPFPVEQERYLFPDAGKALDWARATIEDVVANA